MATAVWTTNTLPDQFNRDFNKRYFDKTIGSMEQCPPVYAVVFDSEILDAVPHDVHDQPVTGVVTPTQTIALAPARH